MASHLMPSYSYGDKVEHYRILRNNNSWVTVDEEEWFENLVELVKVCHKWQSRVENENYSIT